MIASSGPASPAMSSVRDLPSASKSRPVIATAAARWSADDVSVWSSSFVRMYCEAFVPACDARLAKACHSSSANQMVRRLAITAFPSARSGAGKSSSAGQRGSVGHMEVLGCAENPADAIAAIEADRTTIDDGGLAAKL